ncbi:hypothetical protein [Mycolicibacterium sp.]|uniref:hypothetical protein n=1 Tax=Mycolicibacterium sp. TaxID=2320850 RepID=UPI0025CCA9F4|nr:hypothetical protein [Mycolicibacterium sp.]
MTALQPGTANGDRVRSVFIRVFKQRDFIEAQDFWSDESTNYFLATAETVFGPTALTAWFTGSSKPSGQLRGGESGAGPLGAGAVQAYPAA